MVVASLHTVLAVATMNEGGVRSLGRASDLLDDLSAVDSETGQDRLSTLVNSLITTPLTSSSCTSLQEALQKCKNAESAADLHDFHHMLVLVQAAFWIEE